MPATNIRHVVEWLVEVNDRVVINLKPFPPNMKLLKIYLRPEN
jgi:hypothetical protein